MGVLGLSPFLQKTCPEVIKYIPDRLRGLTGKRVVIDGTLITQRLHFAPAPHPYRHVLGWYRLARELQEAGVKAVCVFDGKERNIAKAREAGRRKEAQRKVHARGSLEMDRSKRLKKLSQVLPGFWNLNDAVRERVTGALQQLAQAGQPQTAPITATDQPLENIPDSPSIDLGTKPSASADNHPLKRLSVDVDLAVPEYVADESIEGGVYSNCLADYAEASLLETDATFVEGYIPPDHPWFQDPDMVYSHHSGSAPYSVHLPLEDDDLEGYTTNDHLVDSSLPPGISEPSLSPFAPSTEPIPSGQPRPDIPSQLFTLYLEYQQSVSRLATLSDPVASPPSVTAKEADADTQAEIVMTKAQYQLTLEEGRFWDRLAVPDLSEGRAQSMLGAPAKLPDMLQKLSQTSDLMSASFERRMNPPTSRTYSESKEILKAMGVPCIETTDAVEAEALASSMVLNGLADYVVSEDTDVLVYEAPLVRNLTNKNTPLTIVSGADIRTVLQLSRDSFVDFALLLGTDFSQRIKNVGPARALKFIREHKTIERVIELETKFPLPLPLQAYLDQVELARMIFSTLPPVPETEILEQEPDEDKVVDLLQKYDLGKEVMRMSDWDHEVALAGNYFQDNPSAS